MIICLFFSCINSNLPLYLSTLFFRCLQLSAQTQVKPRLRRASLVFFPLSLCFGDNGVSLADTLCDLGVSVKIFLDLPPLAEVDNLASALGCSVGVLKLVGHGRVLSGSCVPDDIYNKRLALYVEVVYKLFHKRRERHSGRTDVHCMLFTTDTIDERSCSMRVLFTTATLTRLHMRHVRYQHEQHVQHTRDERSSSIQTLFTTVTRAIYVHAAWAIPA